MPCWGKVSNRKFIHCAKSIQCYANKPSGEWGRLTKEYFVRLQNSLAREYNSYFRQKKVIFPSEKWKVIGASPFIFGEMYSTDLCAKCQRTPKYLRSRFGTIWLFSLCATNITFHARGLQIFLLVIINNFSTRY